jgi:hypothetical protein
MSARMSSFFLVNTLSIFISLVGSTALSMTYGINVLPYNDPYIKIAEQAAEAIIELLVAGTFLVDIIPILKYVPEWFPGATFQHKAASLRKHASSIRNATFAATEKSMVYYDVIHWIFIERFHFRPVVTMVPHS